MTFVSKRWISTTVHYVLILFPLQMVASVLQTYSLIYHLLVLLLMVSDSLLVELSCSIRRRALDLLYGMCDVSNAKDIVEELLQVSL
jgi:AP-2 complex subunit alpha